MLRIKLDSTKPDTRAITQTTEVLKRGGLVVCPTETVYIFAADSTNREAVGKVYKIKGREVKKPIHVIVDSLSMAQQYGKFTSIALTLAREFWPGPVTLVLEKLPDKLPDLLTGDLPTIGMRIPPKKFNTTLAKKLGKPYTATSANKSGEVNTYSVDEVLEQLGKNELSLVDLILDVGKLPGTPPSTMIDTTSVPPKILREGPVTREEIEKALGVEVQ